MPAHTTSGLQQTIAAYRAQLLAKEQQALQELAHAHARVSAALQPRIDQSTKQLTDAIARGDVTWLYEQKRLEIFLAFLRGHIDNYAALAQTYTLQAQQQAVLLGKNAGMDTLQATVPDGVSWQFAIPDARALQGFIGATQAGSPLAELFRGFGSEAADAAKTVIQAALVTGDNPRTIAGQLADALNTSYYRAAVIAREEMLRAYKGAALESFRANNDVVDQWRWQADRSSRTCAMCIAMDGTLHDVDEDFESHVQCRCAPVPVTKSWDDILGPLGIDTSDIPDAAMDNSQTGIEWFAKQDETMQRAILGNAKFAAFQAGDITLQDLVGVSHSDEWGTSRYEKSLKDALGSKKAKQYYASGKP